MSQADEKLLAALCDRNVTVSVSQLKSWRLARLVPKPLQTSRGRGRGRTSDAYPPGTAERVTGIVRALSMGGKVRLAEVPIWLFLLGFPIQLDEVRAAYHAETQRIRDSVPQDDDKFSDYVETQLSDATRSPFSAVLKSVFDTKLIRSNGSLGELLLGSTHQLFGGYGNEERLTEGAQLIGFDAESAIEVANLLVSLTYDDVDNLLDDLTEEELVRARRTLANLAEAFLILTNPDGRDSWSQQLSSLVKQCNINAYDGMMVLIFSAQLARREKGFTSSVAEVLDAARVSNSQSEFVARFTAQVES